MNRHIEKANTSKAIYVPIFRLDEKRIRSVFRTADRIIKAGRTGLQEEQE